jgi:hypothetical protein
VVPENQRKRWEASKGLYAIASIVNQVVSTCAARTDAEVEAEDACTKEAELYRIKVLSEIQALQAAGALTEAAANNLQAVTANVASIFLNDRKLNYKCRTTIVDEISKHRGAALFSLFTFGSSTLYLPVEESKRPIEMQLLGQHTFPEERLALGELFDQLRQLRDISSRLMRTKHECYSVVSEHSRTVLDNELQKITSYSTRVQNFIEDIDPLFFLYVICRVRINEFDYRSKYTSAGVSGSPGKAGISWTTWKIGTLKLDLDYDFAAAARKLVYDSSSRAARADSITALCDLAQVPNWTHWVKERNDYVKKLTDYYHNEVSNEGAFSRSALAAPDDYLSRTSHPVKLSFSTRSAIYQELRQ